MEGKQRVKLLEQYSSEYNLKEEDLIQLMLVAKDENQFKRCFGMLLEGFSIKDVVDTVVYNRI